MAKGNGKQERKKIVLTGIAGRLGRLALGRLRRGDLEGLIGSVLIGHHLIMFARAASSGQQNASNYSIRLREASVPAE